MGILNVVKTYVARPIVSFIAGPLGTWGVLDVIKVASGSTGIAGVGLDIAKSAVSSVISTGVMRSTQNTEVFQAKEKVIDENTHLLEVQGERQADDVEKALNMVKLTEQKLNAKGETFVYVLANVVGTGVGFAAKEIMKATNFPNNTENTTSDQQDLIDHSIATSAASLGGMLTQFAAKRVARNFSIFTQPVASTPEAGLSVQNDDSIPPPTKNIL